MRSLEANEDAALKWSSAQVVYDIARHMKEAPDEDRLNEAIAVVHGHQMTVAHDGALDPGAAYSVGISVAKILGG
ncbi:hypothetical protein [Modestobacter marinus]|uniref:hypothetical protein n=1 Tax=Modestobacter marinus TaxID=477641 RepID=UPI001C943BFF|nr:hypothetical protein [Modestobacter marinus]